MGFPRSNLKTTKLISWEWPKGRPGTASLAKWVDLDQSTFGLHKNLRKRNCCAIISSSIAIHVRGTAQDRLLVVFTRPDGELYCQLWGHLDRAIMPFNSSGSDWARFELRICCLINIFSFSSQPVRNFLGPRCDLFVDREHLIQLKHFSWTVARLWWAHDKSSCFRKMKGWRKLLGDIKARRAIKSHRKM